MREYMEELVEKLNKYSEQYYHGTSEITDEEYDKMYDRLLELEKRTNIILPNSPTQKVGGNIEGVKVTHKKPLLSLDKCSYKDDRLGNWYQNLIDKKVIVTKKYDGLTISVTYENGKLIQGATRGNGYEGEDITDKVNIIKGLPKEIPYKGFVIFRGEALMSKQVLEEYNNTHEVPLSNPRNAISGCFNLKDIEEVKSRKPFIIFYDCPYIEGKEFKSYEEILLFIKTQGLLTTEYEICDNIEDITYEISLIENNRMNLDYDIDGAVIRADDITKSRIMGYTSKFPKFAIAYKYRPQETITTLLDVEWNVSRTGKIVPTGMLKPTQLMGSIIKRVTLNNINDINKKKLKINSKVFLRKSNDVIPEVTGVSEYLEDNKDIEAPKYCPSCGSKVIFDGVNYFCPNINCKPQLIKRIEHYASRDAMNIKGLSIKTLELMFEELEVKSIADIYNLKIEDLLTLPNVKDKKAINIINAIDDAKQCELYNFIYALGILNVGLNTAKLLSNKFETLDNLLKCNINDLTTIQDIGEITANNIINFLQDNKEIIKKLNDILDIKEESLEAHTGDLEGINIVITGKFENYTRGQLSALLEERGATIKNTVTKDTTYLIVGDKAGSKLDKANKLDIKVIEEKDLKNLLK